MYYIRNKYAGDYLLYNEYGFNENACKHFIIRKIRENVYLIDSESDPYELMQELLDYLPSEADVLLFKIENKRMYY